MGMNGGIIKGENGYPPPHPNSVNDCMLALDYAHNKVSPYNFSTILLIKLLDKLAISAHYGQSEN
jgi:hypothetical protein